MARETPRTRARDYARRHYLPRLRAERQVTERIVLNELLHLLRPDGTCNPTVATLAFHTGSWPSNVKQALANLEARGMITRRRGRYYTTYAIVVPPEDGPEMAAPDGHLAPESRWPRDTALRWPRDTAIEGIEGTTTREVAALTHVVAAENLSTAPARARKRPRCTWQGCTEPAVTALGFGRWRDKLCFLNYCGAHAAEARRLFAIEAERELTEVAT